MVCPFTTTLTPYVRSIIFDYRVRFTSETAMRNTSNSNWKVLIMMKRGQ